MPSAAIGLQTHGHDRYDSNHRARGADGLAEKAREQVPQTTTDSEQVVGVQNSYADIHCAMAGAPRSVVKRAIGDR